MVEETLVLDPAIRNWVVIPILLILIVVSALKFNIANLMTQTERKQSLQNIMELQTILRAKRLAANSNRIPYQSFNSRKQYFTNRDTGILIAKEKDTSPNPMGVLGNAFKDQSGVTDMLKGNIVNFVPQVGLMTWVNHFFSGFVAVKIPFFPLTIRFKTFLQRGIEMSSLDVSYVSSLSWYFLCWFGMEGINSILLAEKYQPNSTLYASQLEQGVPPQQQPITQLYTNERENIELINHDWLMENAEQRFLNKLKNIDEKKTTTVVQTKQPSSSTTTSLKDKKKR